MPILNVKISGRRNAETSRAVAAMLVGLSSRILGKKPEVTAVAIGYVDPEDWIVAGRSLAEHGKSSFYFDIKVTDETNTKDEKARFLAEAFAGFGRILGDVHEESYGYVEEVRAAAYGYGGRTQEYRYQHPG